MGNYSPQRFDKWKTLFKALWTVAITTAVFEVAQMDLPTTIEEWKGRGPQLGITLALAVIRVLQNLWKTSEVPGNPFYNFRAPWMLALVLLPFFSGCVGFTPALAGKTHYQMDFVDTLADEQNTEFHVKVSAPAGVDITNLASMDYKWNADQSGSVKVAGDTKADTTAQAAALVEVNAQTMQALSKAVDTLSLLVESIAPVIGPLLAQPDVPDNTGSTTPDATLLQLLDRLQR